MGKLILDYDITKLRGAEYNPRQISDKEIEKLKESIKKLGLVKPLIVNGDLLVAGHQRTKALLSLNIKKAPVYLLSQNTSTYDEIRFNQLHNGTDLDSGEENCIITVDLKLGFQVIKSQFVNANFRSKLATVRKEISQLILKYGSWGACVATESGQVIHAAQYAMAAKLTNTELTVFVIPNNKTDEYKAFLNSKYGHFDYGHLPKKTYIQSLAQLYRLRNTTHAQESTLYSKLVLPYITTNKQLRGIDFGSGQGDYATMLRSQKFNILDIEFFRRKGNKLDLFAINKMIDKLIESIEKFGLFDFVVCDSVLNSVDSLEAESSVMAVLNFLCKKGGKIFFSGRNSVQVENYLKDTTATVKQRKIEFLDINNFSAIFRNGEWFYQKWHSENQIKELIEKNCLEIDFFSYTKFSSGSWQVSAIKTDNLSLDRIIAALEFEFNLPLPDGKTINRHKEIIKIAKKLYSVNNCAPSWKFLHVKNSLPFS